ncbi:MAG: LytR C-terminal domain-containing protein [Acidimicrobiales bacterium]
MGSEREGMRAAAGGGGARGVLLLGAALVLGIVLLQQYDTGRAPFSEQVDTNPGPTTSSTRRQGSVSVVPTPTTRPARPADQVKVLAANGTTSSGLGARTTTLLQGLGYNALSPVDATRLIEQTQVQYQPDYEAEARAIALLLQLPVASVRVMEDSPPVPDTRDANILVILGADYTPPGSSTSSTTSTTRRL